MILQYALALAFCVAAVLSGIEAWFLWGKFPLFAVGYLIAFLSCLIAAGLVLGRTLPANGQLSPRRIYLLLGGTLAAFVLMGMGCMGLTLEGCTTACTVIKLVVAPVGCFVLLKGAKNRALSAVGIGILTLALLPNCRCANDPNRVFLDGFGMELSPACYLGPYIAGLFATGAIFGRCVSLFSAGVATLVVVMGTFAIGHQIFHWPW